MSWLYPAYAWLLLAVPVVAGIYLWAAWQRREAIRRFGDPAVVTRLAEAVSPRRRRWKAALVVLGVALTGLALMGPRYGTRLREVKREGIDLVIALDVSLSMQAEDVAPNRFERARNEIKKLLDELLGDRVGLVLFAGDAFLQCPLTTDYNAVRLFLDAADPSLLPTPGTDFTNALRVALRAFEIPAQGPEGPRARALLIVSDGENHAADLDAVRQETREAGVALFTAGVGETSGAPIPILENGQRTFKRDRDGNPVSTRLEEASLQTLADEGAYFRVGRTSSSLPQLIPALERFDRTEYASEQFEDYAEQYQGPLLLAVLLLLAEALLSDRRRPTPKPQNGDPTPDRTPPTAL